ncbi:ATP-dependent protease [Methylacidiphilum kamchatkense Kam1]|uniref:endopeptidase La n=1 Tax=Methylacidiphilum kamchatkense Kam1 TaxID=1202785 RepID=A0A0C1RT22_9BACT|nr:ATP-binding protein [Methylacidiphilum kamchatkense]KIE58116.1 ATP-dependent protease [Methylacidiphilum kamchatkense Kam1]QDQ41557.1 putative ATP-dependent protease [Methylacidiphilum kamchatkense Kam1]
MSSPAPLTRDQIDTQLDFQHIPYESTAEMPVEIHFIGQQRAYDAFDFGLSVSKPGYNIFVMGPPGIGKKAFLEKILQERAATGPLPSDWCYVFNFEEENKPKAIAFAAGKASEFAEDMARLVDDLKIGIPSIFESDEYRTRAQEIEQEFLDRREEALNQLREKAQKEGIALLQTPAGIAFAPFKGGEVLDPEKYNALPEEEKRRIEAAIRKLQEELTAILRQIPKWRKEAQNKLRELNRSYIQGLVSSLFEELKAKYKKMEAVLLHLEEIQKDVLKNAENFRLPRESEIPPIPGMSGPSQSMEFFLKRYKVNVIVDHSKSKGIPIVFEDNPTFVNIIGRIEHIAQMGALLTDFTLIRPGALHRSNGGYLIVDALRVLSHPYSWEGLKRALRSQQIKIEPLGEALGLLSTVSLEPQPIPLNLKVILIGDRLIYYLLYQFDPEFKDLFKITADFSEEFDASPQNLLPYCQLIASLCHSHGIAPLEKSALRLIVKQSLRFSQDAKKFSLNIRKILDLLEESEYWRKKENAQLISAGHVRSAIVSSYRRINRIEEQLKESIQRQILLVETKGSKVGQINGLAVIDMGNFMFGYPTKITARVRFGNGHVIDIEREVKLSGPIHSKGVLILSGFLAGRYLPEEPLSLSATLAFEQSYSLVEGDSASAAELCALLSALSEYPIYQSIAITGSINQLGEIQAIGGVNEKIEGFFDTCAARGLDGNNGVIIPWSNLQHLVLKEEVLEAVEKGLFKIYAVKTIDEAMEILTGIPAGERDAQGKYPPESINGKVEAKLSQFAKRAQKFTSPDQKAESIAAEEKNDK